MKVLAHLQARAAVPTSNLFIRNVCISFSLQQHTPPQVCGLGRGGGFTMVVHFLYGQRFPRYIRS